MTGLWIALAVVGVLASAWMVHVARVEDRKTEAFVASLERMSRRCPACQPWGGWYLGRMREDGSYETHTCDVCDGTGEVAPPKPLVGADDEGTSDAPSRGLSGG